VASLGGVPADLGGVAANGGDPAARDYAVRLLLDAVRPSAPPEVAGRCLTALLTTLATPTTVDALATLLAAAPGAPSHFEVVAEEPGRGRTGHRSHLAADQAVTAALALLRRPGLVIDVFAIAGGLRRRCLQGRDGYLMWVVPDRQELTGPEEEVTAALARWAANLAPIGPVGPPQPTGPTGATKLRPQVDPGVPALPDGARGDPSSSLRVDETAGPGTKDGQGEVAEALRAVLAELTVQVDLGGIEQVVAEAVRMEIARLGRPDGVGRAGPPDPRAAPPARGGGPAPAPRTPARPSPPGWRRTTGWHCPLRRPRHCLLRCRHRPRRRGERRRSRRGSKRASASSRPCRCSTQGPSAKRCVTCATTSTPPSSCSGSGCALRARRSSRRPAK